MARVLKAGPALGRGGSAGAVGATASVGSLLPERLVVLLRESRWLVQCCLAVFLALILLSYHPTDPGWSHAIGGRSIQNLGGRLGAWFADLLLYLFGMTAWLWAAFLMLRVVSGYRQLHPGSVADRAAALDAPRFGWDRWLGFALLFAGCVMLEASRMPGLSGRLPFAPGGVVGHGLSVPLLEQLGSVGGTLAMTEDLYVRMPGRPAREGQPARPDRMFASLATFTSSVAQLERPAGDWVDCVFSYSTMNSLAGWLGMEGVAGIQSMRLVGEKRRENDLAAMPRWLRERIAVDYPGYLRN